MNFLVTTMTHSFDTHQDFVDEHTMDKFDHIEQEIVKDGKVIELLKDYRFHEQCHMMKMLAKGQSVHLRERDVKEDSFPYLVRTTIIAPITQYPEWTCVIPFW